MSKTLFEGRTGLYAVYPEEFEGDDDTKEMPDTLVALAATFVSLATFDVHISSNPHFKLYMALDSLVNNSTSAWNYNSSAVARVYNGHLNELDEIKSKKSTSYHAILRKFFTNCVYVFSSSSVHKI